MMEEKEQQIERISQMERHLVQTRAALTRLEAALDKWDDAQEGLAKLKAYYDSEQWKQDYADDEAGLLPAGLRRGVMSEDAVWNLLTDITALEKRLEQLRVNS